MEQVGIGHNRSRVTRGTPSMYAIVFDLDTQTLETTYPSASWRNAYTDVRNFLSERGFDWMQGSTYFGNDTVDAVKCVTTVQRMAKKFPWFKASVRDVRMLRIEENNDLMSAIEEFDDN